MQGRPSTTNLMLNFLLIESGKNLCVVTNQEKLLQEDKKKVDYLPANTHTQNKIFVSKQPAKHSNSQQQTNNPILNQPTRRR